MMLVCVAFPLFVVAGLPLLDSITTTFALIFVVESIAIRLLPRMMREESPGVVRRLMRNHPAMRLLHVVSELDKIKGRLALISADAQARGLLTTRMNAVLVMISIESEIVNLQKFLAPGYGSRWDYQMEVAAARLDGENLIQMSARLDRALSSDAYKSFTELLGVQIRERLYRRRLIRMLWMSLFTSFADFIGLPLTRELAVKESTERMERSIGRRLALIGDSFERAGH